VHRKRLNDLVRKNDVLYFAGAPYTGQAYAITGQGIVGHIYDVEVGVIAGNSIDMLPLLEKEAMRIEYDFLDYSDDGVILYNGTPFSGVAYSFEQTVLVDESLFSEGLSIRNCREWYISGQPKSIVSVEGTIGWYEDGSIKEQSVTKGDFDVYSLNTGAPNKLRWLTLTDQYECNSDVLETFGLAKRLVLDGVKIDDVKLTVVEKNGDFKNIVSLHIMDSSVTDKNITCIDLTNVKEFRLSRNIYVRSETLQALKKKYPHCEICVDDKYL